MLKDPILITKNNPGVVEVLVEMLKRSGLVAPLRVVPDGEELLAYLKGEGFYAVREIYPLPAVLLLDLGLKSKRVAWKCSPGCKVNHS
jgi:CheY-like chemotaxis protein